LEAEIRGAWHYRKPPVSCNAQTVCTVPDERPLPPSFSMDALKDCGPTAPVILELNIGSRSPSILAGDRP
jgi:hypothetical protein